MKHLVYRADLPHVRTNLFERLRVTTRRSDNCLSHVDLSAQVRLRKGKPRLPRARDRRKWERSYKEAAPETQVRNGVQGAKPSPRTAPPVVFRLQALSSERTLQHFLETRYIPIKLSFKSNGMKDQHRRAVEMFGWYLACEPTFHHLTDDHAEGFLNWLKAAGSRVNLTCNNYLVCLLAQWRFAWKKRFVDELPRDISFLPVPKRIPRAWTLDELGRILRAASETPGDVCDISAGDWWPAQILTFYYSGLHLAAMMQLKTEDLDAETGFLSVPAEVQKQDADQVFRLPPDALEAILAWGPWLIGSGYSRGPMTIRPKRISAASLRTCTF